MKPFLYRRRLFWIINTHGAKTLSYLDNQGFVHGSNGSKTGVKLDDFVLRGCKIIPA